MKYAQQQIEEITSGWPQKQRNLVKQLRDNMRNKCLAAGWTYGLSGSMIPPKPNDPKPIDTGKGENQTITPEPPIQDGTEQYPYIINCPELGNYRRILFRIKESRIEGPLALSGGANNKYDFNIQELEYSGSVNVWDAISTTKDLASTTGKLPVWVDVAFWAVDGLSAFTDPYNGLTQPKINAGQFYVLLSWYIRRKTVEYKNPDNGKWGIAGRVDKLMAAGAIYGMAPYDGFEYKGNKYDEGQPVELKWCKLDKENPKPVAEIYGSGHYNSNYDLAKEFGYLSGTNLFSWGMGTPFDRPAILSGVSMPSSYTGWSKPIHYEVR